MHSLTGSSLVGKKLMAALYYCGSSMTVQFMNKALFTTYGFHFPVTVALLQMLFIAPVCYLVARPPLELGLAKGAIPLATVNVLNVVCGLIGTGGLNVPMFIALRRLTLLCTILLERFILNKVHENATLGAVVIMISGALVAAATDLTFNAYGYAAVLFNDFLTASYLIMVKNTPAASALTTTGLLFYNATLSLPLLMGAVWSSGEWDGLWAYPLLPNPEFLAILMSSCALGLTINHSTFLCTRVNDPLSTSVAGSLKNVLMTFIGIWAFGDFRWQMWNVCGLAISMGGAVWYATRSALKASRRTAAEREMLTRDPDKQPLIGKDRQGAALARSAAGAVKGKNSLQLVESAQGPALEEGRLEQQGPSAIKLLDA
ncbi:hypothetical protein WJX84_008518 [Apatococcus fuscideae]|uniref:Sugar phosphate transporter domain-containing protein n=1 Tax=Apatococcus fuscideae TaxID=2026836 RepID=A0AAW1SL62_9CHLO